MGGEAVDRNLKLVLVIVLGLVLGGNTLVIAADLCRIAPTGLVIVLLIHCGAVGVCLVCATVLVGQRTEG